MKVFAENFRIERIKKGLSQHTTAIVFKVDRTTISTWERGISEPDYMMLKNIADYFDVSADYLIGREDEGGAPIKNGNITNNSNGINVQINGNGKINGNIQINHHRKRK